MVRNKWISLLWGLWTQNMLLYVCLNIHLYEYVCVSGGLSTSVAKWDYNVLATGWDER